MTRAIRHLADLVPDRRNANKGTERGRYMLEQSLRQYGAGRSILVDKDGEIIAGNKTAEAAADLGLPVQVVESDGKRLIVVQRTDLDLDNGDGARELAWMDNRSSEVGLDWDLEQMLADINEGVDLSAMFKDDELAELLGSIPDVEFAEYDESVADGVEYLECPQCGHKWPK